ncbi:hypothetical protein [Methanosarcina sp. 1.H.A.2.2]|jgi:hypothetical protein|uniref:hypothetical protein n=1 Tax=Methanosarcina sp. 1.H.A.2.2 TaxID=1483601 RepID=UPI000621E78A|nr:hypothetical protein [Methanosarcina sp. 1.H.A.2.2]KKH49772.1 hypothetical protein EO93_01800 [Methanosarcina sp. 1.H.A.2.2]
MQNDKKFLGLPYLLAEALRSQIYNIDSTLRAKISLVALIYSITAAVAEKEGLNNEDKKLMEDIQKDISTVRGTYEPILDDPENVQLSDERRKAIEGALDITRLQLMTLIHKHELITESMIKEIQGNRWL